MKKYFYTDGTTEFGPFTLEELKNENITRETNVWFQELGEWKPAGSVPELRELFALTPPPINKPVTPTINTINTANTNTGNFSTTGTASTIPGAGQRPPKTWLVESILVTIFCCLPFGIAGIVNASNVESRFFSGDIDGAEKASKQAKTWTLVSLGLGVAVGVIYFFLILIGAAGSAWGDTYY